MGAKTRGDYPRTLGEFYRRFPSDDACWAYLVETRWPSGFICPACGSTDATALAARRVWECRSCLRQTSASAGTVLHRSKLPLTAWFAAAYLVATLKPGISALQLQRQLGLTRYETAWLLLHKLRRAMVAPDRALLAGTVEVDEAWVGGAQPGLRGGRQRAGRKTLMVVVAVELRPKSLGRVRLEVVPDDTAPTLLGFVRRNIAPGSTVVTDAFQGYAGLAKLGYTHQPVSQAALKQAGQVGNAVPGVHRVISNLKTWLMGTHHGVGADHLDHYLDEFVFRFNRRYFPMAGFATLLGLGADLPPTPTSQILAPLPPGSTTRRKGRATRLTATKLRGPAAPVP